MSEIAKSGFKAERILASQLSVRAAFEKFFGKSIRNIEVIPGSKKTDNRVDFVDETSTRLQLKNYNTAEIYKGHAHQINRRSLVACPPQWIGMLSHICLARPKSKGRMKGKSRTEFYSPFIIPSAEDSKALISDVLLGKEAEFVPEYMVLSNMKDGVIENLWIESMHDFLEICSNAVYEMPQESSTGTSVYICPEISVQRKGGDGGKPSADDIQFKFNLSADIISRHKFVKII